MNILIEWWINDWLIDWLIDWEKTYVFILLYITNNILLPILFGSVICSII